MKKKNVSDQLQSDRFKAEMPQIPGVSEANLPKQPGINPAMRLVAGLLAVLLLCFLGSRWLVSAKHHEALPAPPPPQIEVPAPAADLSDALPRSTEAQPEVATLSEMAKPWSSKDFFFVNRFSSESTRALLIRLPSGSAREPSGYWALAMKAPFGNCQLEYVTDMDKLRNEYDFRAAKHPMVGNPCTRTLFDPLKMVVVPGDIWVRGAMAQGSDLRPPLGVEVKIAGKNILAVRME
jgi:hypothetical protein